MTVHKISPRINFASIDNKVEYPDFLDIQLKSFQSFFQTGTTLEERRNEGLYKTFTELFPITKSIVITLSHPFTFGIIAV